MSLAVDKLLKICDIETDETGVGWRKRRLAMEEWVEEHLIESETELSVVNSEVFGTEMMDLVKERLTAQAIEELTTYTDYDINKNKIKARLVVLKDK
jgi:hypothetical protein